MKTIIDYLKKWSVETPNKLAYTFFSYKNKQRNEEYVNCKEIYERSYSYSVYLREKGLEKGDRVIIFAEQKPETLYAVYGTLLSGGVFTLIPTPNSINKKKRFASTLESSKAKYVITSNEDVELGDNQEYKVIYTADIEYLQEEVELIDIDENDVACLQFTSGSVNEPKGIMLTHKNLLASMELHKRALNLDSDDLNISWLPLFHSMGLFFSILSNAYTNRREIIMTIDVFEEDPLRWLKAISKYRATLMVAPNSAYMTCAQMLNNSELSYLDFTQVKNLVNCSEIIQKSNWDTIRETFGSYGLKKEALKPMYGLSEATGPVSVGDNTLNFFYADWEMIGKNKVVAPTSGRTNNKMLSGVGRIIEGVKVLIVEPNTIKECEENEVGEIWVQGDSIAAGYWNNKELTEKTFYGQIANHEGYFLRTGDLGVIIDGQLYITGRIKEMMVINGKNIYAKDIESNIKNAIPELQSVVLYAFTMPIKKRERIIIGIEHVADQEEYVKLVSQINKTMYEYFSVEAFDIFFVEPLTLARTDNGKMALMRIYHAYASKEIPMLYSSRNNVKNKPKTAFNETQEKIREIFENVLGIRCNSVEDNFLSLGGSSLEMCNLILQLQKCFDINIGLKDVMFAPTIIGIEKSVLKKLNK